MLGTGGMHIQAFFIRPEVHTVRFIQCVAQSAITVLIYIPSDYTLRSDNPRITWEIDAIDLEEEVPPPEDLLEEYAENLQTSLDVVDTTESGLRRGYDIPVNLAQKPREDMTELSDIVSQLDRLKHAVSGIPYGLAVAFGAYLVYLDSGGEVLGYRITDFPHRKTSRRLYVVADLETVYSKMAVLSSDTEKIYRSITGILTKNQRRLAQGLASVIETRGSALQMTTAVNSRAQELREEIEKFGDLYRQTNDAIETLETRLGRTSETTVHEDISGSSEGYRIRKDIQRAHDLRGKIADRLTKLRETYEYLVLATDKILFENILALERVLKNLGTLQAIAEY